MSVVVRAGTPAIVSECRRCPFAIAGERGRFTLAIVSERSRDPICLIGFVYTSALLTVAGDHVVGAARCRGVA